MSFCVFVQYLISNLRCLTTFLTCVEKLTIWEKFEFVQNIGFHHFLDVPWGTKSKKFSNRIVHFILRLIVFWWEGNFFWAEWKCNWCGGWGHKFRPQPEDQELFAKLEGIWNLPKPQVLGKIRRVTNWTKTKKGFYFLTVSCSIAFARLVSSALLLSESTWPPSRIVLGQRPATMCTLWMLYFHFKSQITPKKPSLNLPYFLSAQTKHCQHLKIFHPLKSLRQECRVCKNIHKISSTHRKLLQISWDFISLIKSIKTHPFCHSIAVCQCWKTTDLFPKSLMKVRIGWLLKAAICDSSVNCLLYCYCPLLNPVIAALPLNVTSSIVKFKVHFHFLNVYNIVKVKLTLTFTIILY